MISAHINMFDSRLHFTSKRRNNTRVKIRHLPPQVINPDVMIMCVHNEQLYSLPPSYSTWPQHQIIVFSFHLINHFWCGVTVGKSKCRGVSTDRLLFEEMTYSVFSFTTPHISCTISIIPWQQVLVKLNPAVSNNRLTILSTHIQNEAAGVIPIVFQGKVLGSEETSYWSVI